jgi:hypothetical protein
MAEEKVLARIRKMLAIANDNAAGGEHERDAAMKMVLSLLAKHNLAMSDVAAADRPDEEARIQHREMYYDYGWMRVMADAVAKLYFCHLFTTKSGKKDRSYFTFVGLESNVATAKEMFDYLSKSVVAEASRETTKRGENQTFKWSFCKGASFKIHERCKKLRAEAEAESQPKESTGTALVLASVYQREAEANALAIQQAGIKLKQSGPLVTRNTRGDGYGAGQKYGSTVGLNKQLKGK